MLDANVDIVLEPLVGTMHDLIDRKRRHDRSGMSLGMGVELRLDAADPLIEPLRRPGIERGKSAHDSRLALFDDEIGIGNDEQRCPDQRQRETSFQIGWKRHGDPFVSSRLAATGGAG